MDRKVLTILRELRDDLARSVHKAKTYPSDQSTIRQAMTEVVVGHTAYGHALQVLSAAWRRTLKEDWGIEGGEFIVGTCTSLAEGQIKQIDEILTKYDKPKSELQKDCKHSPSGKHVTPQGEICQYCEEDVMEMRLCEQDHVTLRPDRKYIFTVDPNCANCVAIAERYKGQ